MPKAVGHVVTIVVALVLFLGLPFASRVDLSRTGDVIDAVSSSSITFRTIAAAYSSSDDTTSSASVVLDEPSGSYVILINTEKHTEDTLEQWVTFLSGDDAGVIMEDASCFVFDSDSAGLEMAQSLASRLSENQMEVTTENATLELSKIEKGKFDIVVMSSEAAESYDVESVYDLDFVKVVQR